MKIELPVCQYLPIENMFGNPDDENIGKLHEGYFITKSQVEDIVEAFECAKLAGLPNGPRIVVNNALAILVSSEEEK